MDTRRRPYLYKWGMGRHRCAFIVKLERLHITAFLGLATFVWWLAIGAPRVNWENLQPFGPVVGVLVIIGAAFEYFLWRWSWLHGWFVKRPDLRGTWRIVLQSDWIDPDTNLDVPPIVCYMGVTQTLSTLQMHLMTPESESWFVAERISPSASGVGYQVAGVYTNRPQIHLRGTRSEMHLGGVLLDTHGPTNRPDTITGEYWTDRKTKGRMTFTKRLPAVFTRFDDADRAFEEA